MYTLVVVSIAYVANVAYWILLGALIKPNDVLPFASVVVVLAIHIGSTAIRVESLIDQLEVSKQS